MRLPSVQCDLQNDFAWVADGADRPVVLALPQIAFFGKCDDQGLGPRGRPFSHLPDPVADWRESGDFIRFLHLLRPALLACCQPKLTSLS